MCVYFIRPVTFLSILNCKVFCTRQRSNLSSPMMRRETTVRGNEKYTRTCYCYCYCYIFMYDSCRTMQFVVKNVIVGLIVETLDALQILHWQLHTRFRKCEIEFDLLKYDD